MAAQIPKPVFIPVRVQTVSCLRDLYILRLDGLGIVWSNSLDADLEPLSSCLVGELDPVDVLVEAHFLPLVLVGVLVHVEQVAGYSPVALYHVIVPFEEGVDLILWLVEASQGNRRVSTALCDVILLLVERDLYHDIQENYETEGQRKHQGSHLVSIFVSNQVFLNH